VDTSINTTSASGILGNNSQKTQSEPFYTYKQLHTAAIQLSTTTLWR